MATPTPTLGGQEMDLLNFIEGRGAVTVRDAVDGFGTPRGLARTTVLTMINRLLKKGYLSRSESMGVFAYIAAEPKGDFLARAVKGFVEKALGGSASPLVAYLSREARISEADASELRRLLLQLDRLDAAEPPDGGDEA